MQWLTSETSILTLRRNYLLLDLSSVLKEFYKQSSQSKSEVEEYAFTSTYPNLKASTPQPLPQLTRRMLPFQLMSTSQSLGTKQVLQWIRLSENSRLMHDMAPWVQKYC